MLLWTPVQPSTYANVHVFMSNLPPTIHLRVRRMEMSVWRPAGRPGEDEDDDAD